LPEWLEVWAVQLPGHGSRWSEPAIPRIDALVDALVPVLSPCLRRPFAFFGHSMGAVVASETARALIDRARIVPRHLFLSSRRPPNMQATETDLHTLPDAELIEEVVRRYGGVPRELINEPELLALLLPALRADLAALETFRPGHRGRLPCPISAYGGTQDRAVSRHDLEAWRDQTTASFRVRVFPGDHFYLDTQRAALLADLSATMMPILRDPSQPAVIA
jgi:medium-chain acyl-[acyl-carrier-protein] hydrolase